MTGSKIVSAGPASPLSWLSEAPKAGSAPGLSREGASPGPRSCWSAGRTGGAQGTITTRQQGGWCNFASMQQALPCVCQSAPTKAGVAGGHNASSIGILLAQQASPYCSPMTRDKTLLLLYDVPGALKGWRHHDSQHPSWERERHLRDSPAHEPGPAEPRWDDPEHRQELCSAISAPVTSKGTASVRIQPHLDITVAVGCRNTSALH